MRTKAAEAPGRPAAGPRSWSRPAAVLLLLLTVAVASFHFIDVELEVLVPSIAALGFWGPILFIVVYVLASLLFLPASLLTLAGGALFGITFGILYVWIGAMLGALATYTVGRYGSGPLRPWLDRRVQPLMHLLDEHGIKSVLALRLMPVIPFNPLNYALGFARVRPRTYLIATMIGIIPGTVTYVLIGAAVVAVDPRDLLRPGYLALALGLVLLLGVVGWLGQRIVARVRRPSPPR